MSKILITGGAGFIGCFLAEKLAEDKNNHITIVDNLTRGKMDGDLQRLLEKQNLNFIQGDLRKPEIFLQLETSYEYVYHLAAVIGVKNVMKHPDEVLFVNAVATLNLFERLKEFKNLKKIFYSSTSEVYAGTLKHFGIDIPTAEDVPLTIEDITSNRTTYALSKIYGESIGFVYGRKFDIPVTIGRYHNVYGPRMGYVHVIPETFLKMGRSDVIDVPSPNHTRAFCYIDDAIEFTIRACTNTNTTGEIVHIGNSKEEISVKDLISKIANITDRKITVNEQPDTPGSPARRCPDISKIEKLTAYSPVVALEKGLAKTYEWYRDKLDNAFE
ncbi:GDP-mannose 4,6-dehydratase [Candidatus Pacearchaeota archaeon]|nr:GDP-mannose 4,6-dehydratase [Candidatus Pacearchaeota archaeon]